MKNKKIVLLACEGESTNIIFNSLKKDFKIKQVLVEKEESRVLFLKRRIMKYGCLKVSGQILFKVIIVPYLRFISRKRIGEIKKKFDLDSNQIEDNILIKVSSANSEETISLLKKIKPAIVIINGTRIISEKVLDSCQAKFVNIHAGITPKYRGVHGGYWALVEKNKELCGVTVHFIDKGIDTGNIIEQKIINTTNKDNFITYPLIQLGEGLPLLKCAIKNTLSKNVRVTKNKKIESKLWTHPTIWEYVWLYACRGIK